jgi:phage terminase large subunit-like protein
MEAFHPRGHPVMRWMAGNVVVVTTRPEISSDKGHKPEKIEDRGAIMALDRCVRNEGASRDEFTMILTAGFLFFRTEINMVTDKE